MSFRKAYLSYAGIAMAILGFLSVLTIFLNGIDLMTEVGGNVVITPFGGLFSIFGGERTTTLFGLDFTHAYVFNTVSFISYLAVLLASVFVLFGSKSVYVIPASTLFFLAFGIMMLFEGHFFAAANGLSNPGYYHAGIGPILGGISSILAGIIGGVAVFFEVEK